MFRDRSCYFQVSPYASAGLNIEFLADDKKLPFLCNYICVLAIEACPIILAILSIGIPALKANVPNVWRAMCQLMCLLIPARFTHRFTDLQQLS